MIIFDTVINFIESFLFAFFIAYYFDLPKKKSYITIVTLIQLFILNIFQWINYNGFILTIIIIFIMLLSIFLYSKQLTFNQLFITILYNCLIILCSVSGMIIYRLIINVFNIPFNDIYSHLVLCTVSKILLIIITSLILKVKLNINLSLDLYKWGFTIIFEFFLTCAISIIAYSLIANYYSIYTNYILLIILFFISILFLFIIYKIDIITKEKIQLAKIAQEAQFNQTKYHTIYNIKNEISAIEHRLFYVIFSIEELLEKKEYEDISEIIENYKTTVIKHKLVIDTENEIFDILYSLKINDLIAHDISVNNCIFISKNDFYDDFAFINFLSGLLDFYKDCNLLEIKINEINCFIILNIIHRFGEINIQDLENYLKEKRERLKYEFNIQNFETKGIRISFSLGEDHD